VWTKSWGSLPKGELSEILTARNASNGLDAPMQNAPNRTGRINRVSGVYESVCHPKERTILRGQRFPNCGSCNRYTNWTFLRPHAPKGEERGGKAFDE
jgi:hypothetical protein